MTPKTAVITSPQADADLAAIWDHIATESEAAADRVVTAIDTTIEMIAQHPGVGAPCPHLAPELRRAHWRRFLVYYRIRPNVEKSEVVEIVRILHGSRKISRKLFG